MKKLLFINILLCFLFKSNAQLMLPIPTVIQERDQWCWAGSTKAILDYYSTSLQQCQIAEYTRTVAVWHDFGQTNCCTNSSVGCNYWNYNWGYLGSMQNILQVLGGIANYGQGSALSIGQVTTELSEGRPFIIRWGWISGGGHFIVGKGFDMGVNNIHYMNPWPGEGAKVSTFTWMQNDGNHTWTSTNVLTTNTLSPTGIKSQNIQSNEVSIFPNPANDNFAVRSNENSSTSIYMYDLTGKLILEKTFNYETQISTVNQPQGVYLLKIISGESTYYKKVVLN